MIGLLATGGVLAWRYPMEDAEIQNGDKLVTSGIDGTYPPGLPVATVARIERDAAGHEQSAHLAIAFQGLQRSLHCALALAQRGGESLGGGVGADEFVVVERERGFGLDRAIPRGGYQSPD